MNWGPSEKLMQVIPSASEAKERYTVKNGGMEVCQGVKIGCEEKERGHSGN